jgi:hypothetical protein
MFFKKVITNNFLKQVNLNKTTVSVTVRPDLPKTECDASEFGVVAQASTFAFRFRLEAFRHTGFYQATP